MWTENYSIVPGLGNLHGRLGFNSGFLLLTTLFSYHPDYYPSFYPLNSLCILVFSAWLISRIGKSTSLIQTLGILGIIFCIVYFFKLFFPSPTTDLLPGIIICYILISCMLNEKEFQHRGLALFIVPAFCVTLKLSSAPIILMSLSIIVLFFINKAYRVSLFLAFIGILVFGPWCLRFIIQTGYLIYPFPSIDIFSVDWKMPIEMVQEERDWIYSWGKIPGRSPAEVLSMPFSEWFSIWLRSQGHNVWALYILAIISPILLYIFVDKNRLKSAYLIWSIAAIGLGYCLSTAPDLRFSFGFVLVAGFSPFLLCRLDLVKSRYKTIVPFVLLCIFTLLCLENGIRRISHFHQGNYFLHPIFYEGYYSQESEVNDSFYKETINNIDIYIPKKSDQCMDQCIPCTPYLNKGLEMRGNSLQSGFRIKR